MKTVIVAGLLLISSICYAYQDRDCKDVIYLERSGVIVPVEINRNGTTFVQDSSGSTMIMDNPTSTYISNSNGKSTTIYKNPYDRR